MTVVEEKITAMVTKVNYIANTRDWVVDIGATKHICYERDVFTSYKTVGDGEKVFMRNSNTSSVIEKLTIELWLSSRKILDLKDIIHVPEV